MGAISGTAFGGEIVKALGLGGRMVRELTLTVAVGELVRVRFTCHAADGVTVAVDEYMDSAHLDAALSAMSDVTHLEGGGWRETSRDRYELKGGELTLDGPAERLARAVLDGDADSALVLADLVQELWAGRAAAGVG